MTRLLVADDHPIIVSGLESVLRGTEYEIAGIATDGAEALAAVARVRPDILILDLKMPGLDGIEVLSRLRAERSRLPVVLLTADIADLDLLKALELGVQGIVLKESAPTRLVECLGEVKRGGRWIEQGLLQHALDLKMRGVTSDGALASLSKREGAIARLVAEGLRNREIATTLEITEGTVKVHLHRIYEKLQVGSRTELAILVRTEEGR